MIYRRLGKTELKVSVIGLGTHQFSGEWGKDFTQKEVSEILSKAADLGINLVDTAECYGDHLVEELVGKGIKGKRHDYIIATKFGHGYAGMLQTIPMWSADDVIKQLDASLRALQTDYIDVYQFHSGSNSDFENDDLWQMLNNQVKAGKIRHLGISLSASSVESDDLSQMHSAAKIGVQAIQTVYNRLERKAEEAVFPFCQENDLGVLARVPLAKGFLSGKYKPGSVFSDNDIRSKYRRNQQWLEMVEQIKKQELPPNIVMSEWALAWCLKNGAVSAVIPGVKDLGQLESNARAVLLLNN